MRTAVVARQLQPGRHAASSPRPTDKTARVWDAATGKQLGEPLRHEDEVDARAASARTARRIVTASDDKTARVWDAATGKPHRRAAAP